MRRETRRETARVPFLRDDDVSDTPFVVLYFRKYISTRTGLLYVYLNVRVSSPFVLSSRSFTRALVVGSLLNALANCALNPGHKHVGLALAEPVAGAPAGNYSFQDLTPKRLGLG